MFCFHKYKFVGGGYLEYTPNLSNYDLKMFDVYKCEKCGRIKKRAIDRKTFTYSSLLDGYILRLEEYDYKHLNKYRIKEWFQLMKTEMESKIKRIEDILEQAKFDLEIDKEYMNKSDAELKWQEGIIRGLDIALRILNSEN